MDLVNKSGKFSKKFEKFTGALILLCFLNGRFETDEP